jgi:putative ABC transport system permease protein
MAANQIKNNGIRSFLTVLGITIGIASMITVISVGDGGETRIKAELEKFGVNRAWILPNDLKGMTISLKSQDSDLLLSSVPGIKDIAVSAYRKTYIAKDGKKLTTDVIGTSHGLFTMENTKFSEGRALSETDIDYARKVVILSEEAKSQLFGDELAEGKKVEMLGSKYTVIGVEENEKSIYNSFFTSKCYIPITTFENVFGIKTIDEISLTAKSSSMLTPVLSTSVDVLSQKYGDKSVKYINLQSELENAESIIDIFKTVISAIAAISLLVGGIGIMNIMLVTVKERTREIGIRKALGAKDHHILNQFLFEAIIYSLIGTMLGIWMSLLVINIAGRLLGLTVTISMQSVALSVLFAVTIGVCFGIIPAYKASRLDPVCALRQE